VVTQGALSLYAESKKSQKAVAASEAAPAAAAEAPTPQATPTAAAGPNPLVIGTVAAVVAVGAGVVFTRLGKKN
jgi:cation efflux system membrane fusion protein